MKRWLEVAALAVVVMVASAHIGINDAFFLGYAGPYHVNVVVRAPGAIPGHAQVSVRLEDAGVERVTMQAARWELGTRGAPPPEEAVRVPGDSTVWASPLLLMVSGTYAIRVYVEGPKGRGTALVPFDAVVTRQLGMDARRGWVLAGIGVFLALALMSIAGASARDAVLTPGAPIDAIRRRYGRMAMVGGLAVIVTTVSGGTKWWRGVDVAHAARLYGGVTATATFRDSGGPILRIALDTAEWRARGMTPIIPDHGKLVHLFLVSTDSLGAAGHFHPVVVDSGVYETRTGPLPEGHYMYYADLVTESGAAQISYGQVLLPTPPAVPRPPVDPDDSFLVGIADSSSVRRLPNGATVSFDRPRTLYGGSETMLRFHIRDSTGAPARIEPYMGMAAHAVISRYNGLIFAHLHPNGNVSMASIAALDAIERGDTLPSERPYTPRPRLATATNMHASMPGMMHASPASTPLSADPEFPFDFVMAGRYVIWLQFRLDGQIRTVAFEARVRRS